MPCCVAPVERVWGSDRGHPRGSKSREMIRLPCSRDLLSGPGPGPGRWPGARAQGCQARGLPGQGQPVPATPAAQVVPFQCALLPACQPARRTAGLGSFACFGWTLWTEIDLPPAQSHWPCIACSVGRHVRFQLSAPFANGPPESLCLKGACHTVTATGCHCHHASSHRNPAVCSSVQQCAAVCACRTRDPNGPRCHLDAGAQALR